MWFEFFEMAFAAIVVGCGILLVALSVTVILRALLPPPGIKGKAAHCGACDYQIVDTATGRCPECGVDLVRVGLMTGRLAVRYRASTFGLVAAWTLLCMVVGWPVGGFTFALFTSWGWTQVAAGGPFTSFTKTHTFAPPQTWDEETNQYTTSAEYRVVFDLNVTQNSWATPTAGRIQAVIEVGGEQQAMIELDLDETVYRIFDADGKVVDRMNYTTGTTGADVFEAAGLDVSDQGVRSDADAFITLFESSVSQPSYFDQMQGNVNVNLGGGGGAAQTPGFLPVTGTMTWNQAGVNAPGSLMGMSRAELVLFWIFVVFGMMYLVSLVVLLRIRRRMLDRVLTAE